MQDFLSALGLVLVIEGVLCAAVPSFMRHMAKVMETTPDSRLRNSGLVTAGLGVLAVWFVRG